MNRQEFLRQLEYQLRDIPENERMDALAYYNDYFDEAGVENEQRVIIELGSPEQVAASILNDYYSNYEGYENSEYAQTSREYADQNDDPWYNSRQTNESRTAMVPTEKNNKKSKWIFIIIVLIVTFPIWIGIVAGLFGGVVGVLGGLFGTVVGLLGAGIGLLIGGAVCVAVGVFRIFTMPLEGFTTVAVGSFLLAISVLLILLMVSLLGTWIPKLVKWMVTFVKGLLHRLEGGDEI